MNSTAREVTLTADFLKKDINYKITLIKDGINADRQAMDFKQQIQTIKPGEAINISMVKDGGWVARIEPVN